MNLRFGLTVMFIIIGLALTAGLVSILVRYAMPRPAWVALGRLGDFPPSDEPYAVRDVDVFLVNDGKEIIVLDPLNPAPGGVNVLWNADMQSFIDPLRGSWFSLYGIPKRRAGSTFMESQSLRLYDLKIQDGLVSINLSALNCGLDCITANNIKR